MHPLLEYVLNIFRNVKKNTKISHVYLDMLHAQKKKKTYVHYHPGHIFIGKAK
jgi:hypothetical protein